MILALAALSFGQDVTDADYSVDIEHFRPATDTFGYATTSSAATLQNLQLGVGLWGNYSEDEVVMIFDGERVLGNGAENGDGIIDNRSVVDLQVGLGISKYFSFTVGAPVVLWQEGYEPLSADNPNRSSDLVASGMLDMRLVPKLVLVDLDKSPVGIAVQSEITIPTGLDHSFLGEAGGSATPMFILEAADGPIHGREYKVRGAVNVGYHARGLARFRDLVLHNEFVYRAGFAVHPSPIVELGGDLNGAIGGPRPQQRPLEVGPYLRLIPQELVTVTAGAAFGVMPGVGAPDFRVYAGATLAPSFDPSLHDADKDGIYNNVDQCKFDPEDKDDYQDEDGCPDPDNDADGILDEEDRCPLDPEDPDGYKDDDGCPDLDNDKDGILDLADRCPDDPETVNSFQDDDGCPDDKPVYDTDGDGYKDDVDRCPYDPEDFDDFQDEDGCPDLDNDQDTILDKVDDCPNDKEVFNQFQDEDGCPDEAAPSRVVVQKDRVQILDRIEFEYNKATIRQESYGLMDEIARVLLEHPELIKIRVEGHTDSDGSDTYNLRLSQARAESVVNYLVASGVPRASLEPVGFGESRALVPNDSDANKQTNRRVEFLIVERSE